MMDVWGWQNGVLKVTACQTDTDKNVQDGIKFLSAGLMRAMRNPTAHEPALHWPITKQDCLDMLNFVSFLLRQLDKAVYYKGVHNKGDHKMNEANPIDLLFGDMEKLGPGSNSETLKVLDMLPKGIMKSSLTPGAELDGKP